MLDEKLSYDELEEEEDIDERLVKEARNLLKEDWKKNGNKYSEKHYADLVDEHSPHTCWRYIIHREYDVGKAVELMKSALKWRKENRLDGSLNSEFIKEFWFHNPLTMMGPSKSGKEDVFYSVGKNYRRPNALLKPYIRRFLINTIMQWDYHNRSNLRKAIVVIDCTDCGLSNTDLDLNRWLFSIKDFLPSRVSVVNIIGIPYILIPTIRLIISWLPSNYRNFIKFGSFEELVAKNIGPESLPPDVGGTAMKVYLAPIEAPWMVDEPKFMTDEMQKAMKEYLWYHVSEERWDQMRSQQIDFETKAKDKSQKLLEIALDR